MKITTVSQVRGGGTEGRRVRRNNSSLPQIYAEQQRPLSPLEIEHLRTAIIAAAEPYETVSPEVHEALLSITGAALESDIGLSLQGLRMAAVQEVTFNHPLQAADRSAVMACVNEVIDTYLSDRLRLPIAHVSQRNLDEVHRQH